MSALMLQRPKHFGNLQFVCFAADKCAQDVLNVTGRWPEGWDGRMEAIAPCGCAAYTRMVTHGPLAMTHFYAGGTYTVCDSHCQWCEECEQQLWPHNDCVCD